MSCDGHCALPRPVLCPRVEDVFEPAVVELFTMRLRVLQEVATPDRTILEVYNAWRRLCLYRILRSDVFRHYSPGDIKLL